MENSEFEVLGLKMDLSSLPIFPQDSFIMPSA